MNIYILSGFQIIGMTDTYKSVIWNEQYYGLGDLQLIVSATPENLAQFKTGRYLVRDDCITANGFKNVMIIENIQISFSVENGLLMTITGKSLKNLLSRRIVWQQITNSGELEDTIRQVINDNVITPSNEQRAIANFVLGNEQGFTETADIQLLGENIAEWLQTVCETNAYGWKIDIINNKYVFTLYKGTDRTVNQSTVTPVIFSKDFDNLITADNKSSIETYKNSALVIGEERNGEKVTVGIGDATDLNRYETKIDGSSITSNGGVIIPPQYDELLIGYGTEELGKLKTQNTVEATIDPNGIYKLNRDYFLGDLVTLETIQNANSRITEIIYSEDENGISIVPTFSEWEVQLNVNLWIF